MVVLSLLAVLTVTGVILYYSPLLCLRGGSSPSWGGLVLSPTTLSFLGCSDHHPSPRVSSCSRSKPWGQTGWKRKAVPWLSASGTFPLPSPGSCTVLGPLPSPCDLHARVSMRGCGDHPAAGGIGGARTVKPARGAAPGPVCNAVFPFPSLPLRCCVQVSAGFPQHSPAWLTRPSPGRGHLPVGQGAHLGGGSRPRSEAVPAWEPRFPREGDGGAGQGVGARGALGVGAGAASLRGRAGTVPARRRV